ncbi:LPXTG cell wall anchor domain-containing protein [Streptomyces flavochromogenes]|uniref:LPXTG cell wall anchor domain-containing protein n=1 Tax=Streptomyces flavochromogenes TaxID=68199 RepID=A0ABW6XK35_9ACTN
MTKQMRIRIARIAAGAVIAAGASLTAAGAAQAVGAFGENDPTPTPTCIPGTAGCQETTPPETTPPVTTPPETTPPVTTPPVTTPPVTTPPVTTPPETTPPVTTPPVTTPPETTPPVTTPPVETTEPGTGETTEPGPVETTEPGPVETTGPADGGTDNGDAGTCTVDLDGAECVDSGNSNTDTNNAGSQPVQQGQAKEELAETGAAETSFLIIGAATMIAGGIGFRMLPRLVGGGRAAV